MSIWFASLVAIWALLLPFIAAEGQARPSDQKNVTTIVVNAVNSTSVRAARAVKMPELLEARVVSPSKMMTGDSVSLETALDSQRDLMTAAGEHKKYILVKKKPKHKKIKMEVFKPKMKYKKIKMKVPVKKMKKKKVKGYLVKKEKHYH